MTSAEANAAITRLWLLSWPTLSSGVLAPPNDGPVPSVVDDVKRKDVLYLAALTINELDSNQYTMGPAGKRKYERTGVIVVRLTGPLNEGRGELDQLAEKVRALFESVRIARTARDGGIITEETLVAKPGKNDKETLRFTVRVCSTTYRFTEIK